MTYWRAHTKEAWGVGGVAHLHVPFVYNEFVTVGRFESKSKRASRRQGLSLSLSDCAHNYALAYRAEHDP